MSSYRHLFGPVPSRRFGRSLGVDLIPLKTCSLDCVFCQLGRTTHKTVERKVYVQVKDVIAELERWRDEDGQADYITLSGSGEPTLHAAFGEVLAFIRGAFALPGVLLSNGTLFDREEVREAARAASVVKLSLSAWDAASFERVNRPHPAVDFERMVEGMRAFRETYTGEIWMETVLLPGFNDQPEQVDRMAGLIATIRPDRIHLNTAVRPPAEPSVRAMRSADLEALAGRFRPRAEVIAGFPGAGEESVRITEARVLDMLARRPCTIRQVAEVFGLHVNEVSKYMGDLVHRQRVQSVRRDGEVYFMAESKTSDGARGETGAAR